MTIKPGSIPIQYLSRRPIVAAYCVKYEQKHATLVARRQKVERVTGRVDRTNAEWNLSSHEAFAICQLWMGHRRILLKVGAAGTFAGRILHYRR